MPTLVFVRGEGFVVRRWLVFRRRLGFFATRFITAPSPQAAAERALSELRGDPRFVLTAVSAPKLVVEEVEEIEDQHAGARPPGIVFFPEVSSSASSGPAT